MSAFPTQVSGDGSRGSLLGAAAGHQTSLWWIREGSSDRVAGLLDKGSQDN